MLDKSDKINALASDGYEIIDRLIPPLLALEFADYNGITKSMCDSVFSLDEDEYREHIDDYVVNNRLYIMQVEFRAYSILVRASTERLHQRLSVLKSKINEILSQCDMLIKLQKMSDIVNNLFENQAKLIKLLLSQSNPAQSTTTTDGIKFDDVKIESVNFDSTKNLKNIVFEMQLAIVEIKKEITIITNYCDGLSFEEYLLQIEDNLDDFGQEYLDSCTDLTSMISNSIQIEKDKLPKLLSICDSITFDDVLLQM